MVDDAGQENADRAELTRNEASIVPAAGPSTRSKTHRRAKANAPKKLKQSKAKGAGDATKT
jgi:hypothetical protein